MYSLMMKMLIFKNNKSEQKLVVFGVLTKLLEKHVRLPVFYVIKISGNNNMISRYFKGEKRMQ